MWWTVAVVVLNPVKSRGTLCCRPAVRFTDKTLCDSRSSLQFYAWLNLCALVGRLHLYMSGTRLHMDPHQDEKYAHFFIKSSVKSHLGLSIAVVMQGICALPAVNKTVCATEVQSDQLNVYCEGYRPIRNVSAPLHSFSLPHNTKRRGVWEGGD